MPSRTSRPSAAAGPGDGRPRWEITPGELRRLRAALDGVAGRTDLEAALTALANWALALIDAAAILVAVEDPPGAPASIRGAAGRAAARLLHADASRATGAARLEVPIQVDGVASGRVLARPRPRQRFGEEDAELLRLVATQAGIAIGQHRADRQITALYERERRRAEQLQALADIGRSLVQGGRLTDLLDFTVAVLKSRFGYDQVAVYLRDAHGDFVLRAVAGGSERPGQRLDLERPAAAAWAARSGETQLVADRRELATGVESAPLPVVSELAVPIGREGRPDGVLALAADTPSAFDENDLTLAGLVADELEIALENLRLAARARDDAAAAERARLARELHDDTAQQLVAIGRRLDLLRLEAGDARLDGPIETIQDMVDAALLSVRQISRNLRPTILEDLGLVAGLEALAADASARSGPRVEVEVAGEPRPLPPGVELAFFRIAQEALANSLRHAQPTGVRIRLRFGADEIALEVEDDGRGFAPPARLADLARRGGMGVLGMRERAAEIGGHLAVESGPGRGTRVGVSLPTGWSDRLP